MHKSLCALIAALTLSCGERTAPSGREMPKPDAVTAIGKRDAGILAPDAGSPLLQEEGEPDMGHDYDTHDAAAPFGKSCVLLEWFLDHGGLFDQRFYLDTFPQIRDNYGAAVEFSYRHFPLEKLHPNSWKAAEASECARLQDAYEPYQDLLFRRREEWLGGWSGDASPEEALALFGEYAAELGLGKGGLLRCVEEGMTDAIIRADVEESAARGVYGVPTFFINGEMVAGAQPYEVFARVIDAAAKDCN